MTQEEHTTNTTITQQETHWQPTENNKKQQTQTIRHTKKTNIKPNKDNNKTLRDTKKTNRNQ